MIEKQNFKSYKLDEEKDNSFIVVSVKLNKKEQEQLKEDKKLIQQPKDSTAIKQLMKMGSKVIRDKKIGAYLNIIRNNLRRNQRIGIVEVE